MTKHGWGYIVLFVASGLGIWLFYHLTLPLPWMLGALFGALIAANIPALPLTRPSRLANPVRMVLGVAIGSAFTPALLKEAGQYLLSLLLLIPLLIAIVWCGLWYFEKLARFDRRTAFFCALPGGLLEMTMICEAYGADLRRVALIHTLRVLMIVYSVPFTLHHWTQADLSGRTRLGIPLLDLPVQQGMLMLLAGLAGWWLMHSLRLSGASLVGPMVLSAIAYATGWITVRVPDELINAAQWILGASVGSAFTSLRWRDVVLAVPVTLGYFGILMTLSLGVALVATWITGVPLVAAVLAFIPGGQAEMNVIALMVGVAVPYIALHHLVRVFLVMTVAPVLSNRILGPVSGKDRP